MTGLSREKFERFVREWLSKHYAGTVRANSLDVFSDGSSGLQVFTWTIDTKRGALGFPVGVAKTDDGLKVVHVAAPVIGLMAYDENFVPAHGREKLLAYAKNMRLHRAELERLGVKRLPLDSAGNTKTLEQFISWSEERYQRTR